jgi:hypothetical protein
LLSLSRRWESLLMILLERGAPAMAVVIRSSCISYKSLMFVD